MRERVHQQSENQKRQLLLEHEMKLLRSRFDSELKEKTQTLLNNVEEDIQDA